MTSRGHTTRLTYHKQYAEHPMPAEQQARAERLFAKLIAQAFAAEHPELFGGQQCQAHSPASESSIISNDGQVDYYDVRSK